MRAWARMHGNELALVFLAVLAVAVVLAIAWLEPQVIPVYCPANPDYCPSFSP